MGYGKNKHKLSKLMDQILNHGPPNYELWEFYTIVYIS